MIMKIVTRLLLGILLFSIVGCATTGAFQAFQSEKDPFSPDKVHYFSSAIDLKKAQLIDPSWSFFRVHFSKVNSENIWYFETKYSATNWLFVNTLKFVVDGKVSNWESGPNPTREVNDGIMETNLFIVDEQFLNSLSTANSIIVRLSGDKYYIDQILTPTDIHNIKWFINYVNSVQSPK
jgi:hypothetical protein